MRWYRVVLECGHVAEPIVRYKKNANKLRRGGWAGGSRNKRSEEDALPAPKKMRCHKCQHGAPKDKLRPHEEA